MGYSPWSHEESDTTEQLNQHYRILSAAAWAEKGGGAGKPKPLTLMPGEGRHVCGAEVSALQRGAVSLKSEPVCAQTIF